MSKSRCATLALLASLLLLASTAFAQGLPDLSGGGSAIHVGGSNEPGAASSPRADTWSVAMRALRQVLDPSAWTWRSGADAAVITRTPASIGSLALRGRVSARGPLRAPADSRQP